jgi:hypothetical protein
LDDTSFLQCLIPFPQVAAARSDGRWASAYAGSATMVMR